MAAIRDMKWPLRGRSWANEICLKARWKMIWEWVLPVKYWGSTRNIKWNDGAVGLVHAETCSTAPRIPLTCGIGDYRTLWSCTGEPRKWLRKLTAHRSIGNWKQRNRCNLWLGKPLNRSLLVTAEGYNQGSHNCWLTLLTNPSSALSNTSLCQSQETGCTLVHIQCSYYHIPRSGLPTKRWKCR